MKNLIGLFLRIATIFVLIVAASPANSQSYLDTAKKEVRELQRILEQRTGQSHSLPVQITNDLQPGGITINSAGVITFPLGAHLVIHNACTMSEYIRQMDISNNQKMSILNAYNSYLSHARDFGAKFYQPSEFLKNPALDINFSGNEGKIEDGPLVANCRNSMIAFLLAHESSHKRLGHEFGADITTQASQDQEQAADDEAMETVLRAKIFPVVGLFQYFPVINTLMKRPGGDEQHFDHPLPHTRMKRILIRMIVESETGSFSDGLPKSQVALFRSSLKILLQEAERRANVSSKFENTSGKDDKLLSFALNDAGYAVLVGRYYIDGGHGVTKDLVMARAIYEEFIKRVPTYYIWEASKLRVDAAEAWAEKDDYQRACLYLRQAAATGYMPGIKSLQGHQRVQRCLQ